MPSCLTARGVVRETRADGSVELELTPSAACRGCRGACLWRRLGAEPPLALHPRTRLAAGTEVAVSVPERFVLRAALLMHGLPWAALLAGGAAGAAVSGGDLGTLVGAVSGLGVGVALTPGLRRRFEARAREQLELDTVE